MFRGRKENEYNHKKMYTYNEDFDTGVGMKESVRYSLMPGKSTAVRCARVASAKSFIL